MTTPLDNPTQSGAGKDDQKPMGRDMLTQAEAEQILRGVDARFAGMAETKRPPASAAYWKRRAAQILRERREHRQAIARMVERGGYLTARSFAAERAAALFWLEIARAYRLNAQRAAA